MSINFQGGTTPIVSGSGSLYSQSTQVSGTPREMLAKFMIGRHNKLVTRRQNFSNLFQEASDFIIPRKSNITIMKARGQRQTTKLLDGTAVFANTLLASTMQSTLTSTSINWFNIVTTRQHRDLMELDEVLDWLEEVGEVMLDALRTSNFEAEIHEVYLDLGGFGTGNIMEEEKPVKFPGFNGLVFESLDLSEYYVEEGFDGLVNEVSHTKQYTPLQAAIKFGRENFGPKMSEAFQKKPDLEVTFLHNVFPRAERNINSITNNNMEFASVWTFVDGQEVVRDSGFRFFPYAVPRWEKTSGEVYGRSPGMIALPDIRSLNEAKKLDFRAWTKAIDPPIITDDESVLGAVITRPNAINVIRPGAQFAYLKSEARFEVTTLKTAELQDSIRKAFFSDRLVLPPFQGTPMTATEVQARREELNRIIGPAMGRLQNELLRPIVKNTFRIMSRRGALPEPPVAVLDRLQQSGQQVLDVQFKGPLARTQQFADVVAMRNLMADIVPLAERDPSVFDRIDLDQVVKITAERLDVPEKAIRGDAEVEAIRAARAEQADVEDEQTDAVVSSQALKNVAPFIKATQPV